MSCIAGVGGHVRPLVQKAQSAAHIIAIDGCSLKCSKHCLDGISVEIEKHYVLSDFKVKKVQGQDFDINEAKEVFEYIKKSLSD